MSLLKKTCVFALIIIVTGMFLSSYSVQASESEPLTQKMMNFTEYYQEITPFTIVRLAPATLVWGWFHIDMAVSGVMLDGPMATGRNVPGGTMGNVIGTHTNFVRVQTQGFGTLWFRSVDIRMN